MKYISVVIDNKTRATDTFYTYKAPGEITVGDVVKVPFNRGNSEKRGFVFQENPTINYDESKIKEIIEKDPDLSLTPEIISTSMWMKQRYGIKYVDAVRCFIPPGKSTKEGKEKRPLKETPEDVQIIDELTAEQKKATEKIFKAINKCQQKNFLIHGVTGSGKTEIYMQAIEETIKHGKSAIMLVPEIALTKQITERFVGRFGREIVAILHSKLTARERFDEWQRIRSGEAKVVIGARMAVFAPVENIGLIVMDEEHEQTYKSDKNPKYDTVDIALKRIMYYKGVLILGSATPSVVSYQRAREGIYEKLELFERYNGVELPEIDVVDMRDELKIGNRTIFSNALMRQIEETLAIGEKTILFLNRRGYSNFVKCRECGSAVECQECGISMTYHKDKNALVCHYCGKTMPMPKTCPTCGSKTIKGFGVGTEQVEEFAKKQFPDANVARFDLDTAKNAREINRILNSFAAGKIDILVGTQLVAKGMDFKNVGLVGVIAADSGLNIPDYRSSERTFQLITQVAGRAGRGEKKGKVIVQTYSPDSIAIKYAAEYDYINYFENEIRFREMMNYPPFSDLILVEFTDASEDRAWEEASRFNEFISGKGMVDSEDEIFAPRISSKFKGSQGKGNAYRYHLLIKSKRGNRNKYLARISAYIDKMVGDRNTCSVGVDVNPYSII